MSIEMALMVKELYETKSSQQALSFSRHRSQLEHGLERRLNMHGAKFVLSAHSRPFSTAALSSTS